MNVLIWDKKKHFYLEKQESSFIIEKDGKFKRYKML